MALFEEPLFSIADARDSQTGAAVSRVVLRQYLFNGSRAPLELSTDQFGLQPKNVVVSGTELLCTVICAFGASEGDYTFTFGATGYRDTTFTISNAIYTRARGNCPRYFSGGTALRLRLTAR